MTSGMRTVVVIGCSRGIGLGVLKYLAQSGTCRALVGVARKQSDVDHLKATFTGNTKVLILCGDVTDAKSMVHVAAEVDRAGLVPELLLCNAGVLTTPRPFTQVPTADMLSSYEVNVMGPWNAMSAFLPLMRHVVGAVMVNVSSGWGLWGEAGQSTYCATKHALEGLVKCAALEVAADEVSIVTVRPGVVFTDMLAVAVGGKELAREKGVPVEVFAPQFCAKIMAITKEQSGTHIDCGYKVQ